MTRSADARDQGGVTVATTLAEMSWVALAAYAIGLLCQQTYDSIRGIPSGPADQLLSTRPLLFGAMCIGLTLINLWAIAANDRNEYEPSSTPPRPLAAILATAAMSTAITTGVVIAMIGSAAVLTGASVAGLGGALFLLVVGIKMQYHSARRGHSPIAAAYFRAAMDIKSDEIAARLTRIAYLAALSAVTGLALYPSTSPAFGGGAGVRVLLMFGDAPGEYREVVAELLREEGEFLIVRDTANTGNQYLVRYVVRSSIREMLVLKRPMPPRL